MTDTAITTKREEARLWAEHFLDMVRQEAQDTGKAAAMRRNAGETLATARNVLWFYGLAARSGAKDKDGLLFLSATLMAQSRDALKNSGGKPGDFGATLARLKQREPGIENSAERRLKLLIDSDLEPDGGGELAFRLRQVVRWALSHGAEFDWAQLLLDLCDWNYPSRSVQKRWAKSYFAPNSIEEVEPTEL